ncbi:MAG: L-glutamate gamma-semialdehyde dehydrogenase [Halothece sp.]
MTLAVDIENQIQSIAKSLFQEQETHHNFILNWTIERPELRRQLFQLVDCLPTLNNNPQLAQHIKEYLTENEPNELPKAIATAINFQKTDSLQAKTTAVTFQQGVKQLAKQFIIGESTSETLKTLKKKARPNVKFSIDILGEAVVSEQEAHNYLNAYQDLIKELGNQDTITAQVSVKLTALYARTSETDPEGSKTVLLQRLRPLVRLAKSQGVTLHFDMEQQQYKNLTLETLQTLLLEPEFSKDTHIGITLQAYLKDAAQDLEKILRWLENRQTPIILRLVKGAYWDQEYIKAQQNNWQQKVFTDKAATDQNFETLTETLLKNHRLVYPAIATHNLRSIANAIAIAQTYQVPTDHFELQVLYGMGDTLATTLAQQGYQARIYCPQGDLLPGMSYLIRRLLENTANTSFLKQVKSQEIEQLIAKPTPSQSFAESRQLINAPNTDFSQKSLYEEQQDAIKRVRQQFGQIYNPILNGVEVTCEQTIPSLNPSQVNETIGFIGQGSQNQAEDAVQTAKTAFPDWKNTPSETRCQIIEAAADLMEAHRQELNAWVCLESGKPIPQADPETSEAIDFCRYYARLMRKLSQGQDFSVPGETNFYHYFPRGTAVVISPWNFPIAITTGMTVAALVTGNCVILKPASNTVVIAAKICDLLYQAGIPKNVLQFLPGRGGEVGNYLIQHSEVQTIAFTGSQAVGQGIIQQAANCSGIEYKRVIAEMGGKNAIIIDESADLDAAVAGVVQSAFGYAGQKCSACSRAIVVDSVYESFCDRLKEATVSLAVGKADDPQTQVGPVIDHQAYQRIQDDINHGLANYEVTQAALPELKDGFYISPTLFFGVDPEDKLAQEEIFGPVLSVIKADSFANAIAIANNTQYALTGGVYSRTPSHLEQARNHFQVGNLYLNRGITGSIVARQPFGGFKQSGIGAKAGGPDYLTQFMNARVITENTQRQGFALL